MKRDEHTRMSARRTINTSLTLSFRLVKNVFSLSVYSFCTVDVDVNEQKFQNTFCSHRNRKAKAVYDHSTTKQCYWDFDSRQFANNNTIIRIIISHRTTIYVNEQEKIVRTKNVRKLKVIKKIIFIIFVRTESSFIIISESSFIIKFSLSFLLSLQHGLHRLGLLCACFRAVSEYIGCRIRLRR